MIASCGFLEGELRQFSKEEGVTLADSCGESGRRSENKSEKARRKRKNEEEEVQCEVLNLTEEKSFSKELRDSWCQELVTCRYDASKDLESSCGGYVSYGKVEIVAAAGNTSTTSLSLFMETYALEVEEELSSMATQCWAEGVWTGKRSHEQK